MVFYFSCHFVRESYKSLELTFLSPFAFQNDPSTSQVPGSKDMLGILNEEDSGSEVGGEGDYFGRTPR